jgi:hypothetical protein
MTLLRQGTLWVASMALNGLYALYRARPAVWRLMARNYRPWMGRLALHGLRAVPVLRRGLPGLLAAAGRGLLRGDGTVLMLTALPGEEGLAGRIAAAGACSASGSPWPATGSPCTR